MTTVANSQHDDRQVVGVVGLGYVGLPLALSMVKAGYRVVGVDIDADRVESLREGESYVNDVSDEAVATALADGFQPTTEYEALSEVVGVSICVPTPLRKTDTPDLSYVVSAAEQLASVIPTDCTVILESTVYPGATEELVAPTIEENGRTVGDDVFVAFSPERIDPGNETYGPTAIPKVFGGVTDECGDRAEALYSTVFDTTVRVSSATEAELVKLLENTFRAVNIGLINELAQVAHELDVDIWETIDAAATKPFGFMPFYPGPGLGGHCIPVDPMYLSWKAGKHNIDTRFIELADTVNREMPDHVLQRVTALLNDRGIPLSEASILVVGVAYKPNVSDTRESAAYDIIGDLNDASAAVSYHDPFVPTFTVENTTYQSVDLSPDRLETQDCLVVVTDHNSIDFSRVAAADTLVFDTRNAVPDTDDADLFRL
jgi:UDP-N-acetyl-D-glucosamine dehydrogenase